MYEISLICCFILFIFNIRLNIKSVYCCLPFVLNLFINSIVKIFYFYDNLKLLIINFIYSVIYTILIIQILLVCLKIDGSISVYWNNLSKMLIIFNIIVPIIFIYITIFIIYHLVQLGILNKLNKIFKSSLSFYFLLWIYLLGIIVTLSLISIFIRNQPEYTNNKFNNIQNYFPQISEICYFSCIFYFIISIYIIILRKKLTFFFLNIIQENKHSDTEINLKNIPNILYRHSNMFFKIVSEINFEKIANKCLKNNKINDINLLTKPKIEKLKLSNKNKINNNPDTEENISNLLTNTNIDNNLCSICCNNEIDNVYYPCYHSGICNKCNKNLYKNANNCYICKEPILNILKIKNINNNIFLVDNIIKLESNSN